MRVLLGSTSEGGKGSRGTSRTRLRENLDCHAVSAKAAAYLRGALRLGGPSERFRVLAFIPVVGCGCPWGRTALKSGPVSGETQRRAVSMPRSWGTPPLVLRGFWQVQPGSHYPELSRLAKVICSSVEEAGLESKAASPCPPITVYVVGTDGRF